MLQFIETLAIIVLDFLIIVEYFKIIYSDEIEKFLDSLNDKERKKIIYNIDKAKLTQDPELFKKLDSDIWEFRTNYRKTH